MLLRAVLGAAARGAARTAVRRTLGNPYGSRSGFGFPYGAAPYRRRRSRSLVAFLLLALIGGYGYQRVAPNLRNVPSQTISGRAQQVIDGDTFHLSGHSIRLWGIDAPERDTPQGPASTRALQTLLRGRTINCQPAYWSYQRLVARCTAEGRDISEILVRTGWASDLPGKSGGAFSALEQQARNEHRGIWK